MNVIVFHHALGLTPGVLAFADGLRQGGHNVAAPDMYDGERFATVDEGVAYAESVGFESFIDLGAGVAASTDDPFAVVGFSLGVLPAQHLAQTHSRCRAAALCHAAVALGTFSDVWPSGVGLQLHNAERDPIGDIDEARDLAAAVPGATLYEYDTSAHLPTDSSLGDHDPRIAELVLTRTLDLLNDST